MITLPRWLLLLATFLVRAAIAAEDYPTKPIRVIVAVSPGGPVDIITRVVSQKLTESFGQSVIADNRPGAGGNIGTVLVAHANPDGYTLLSQSSAFAVNPSLYSKAGYDPFKDLAPIINAGVTPNIVFVHPSLRVQTLQELIALGKRQKLSYASPGTGTTPHLTAELLLKTLAGMDIAHVPYAGAGPAVTGVVSGQIPVGSTALTAPVPLIRAGKLRAIVVTSPQRIAALPEVPTAIESGYPGYEDYTWVAFFAPAATPKTIVDKLNRDINKALQLVEVKERLATLGFKPQPNTPEQFAAFLKSEVTKWAKVVKDSGAKVD